MKFAGTAITPTATVPRQAPPRFVYPEHKSHRESILEAWRVALYIYISTVIIRSLQALPKIDELVEKAKKGMDALALTDTGNMHGAIEFYKAAKKAN